MYLLDEELQISEIGLISKNLSNQIISDITELSYRETAENTTRMTGQRISAMGVWNVVQSLGEKVCEEERALVKAHKAGKLQGKTEAAVLFEEADGVSINLQREKQKKAEVKVGIAYDGWVKTGTDRYALDGKVAVAGISTSYFKNNRSGLIPYSQRGITLPEGDLIYRNMGTMENHIWSIIARRMKHNHTSWSIKGANNLAKILAKKASGKLNEVAAWFRMPVIEKAVAERIEGDIISAAKAQKKSGSGYEYPIKGRLEYLYNSVVGSAHGIWRDLAGV